MNQAKTHIWDREFPQLPFTSWDGVIINTLPGFEYVNKYYKITRDGLLISDRGPLRPAAVYTGRTSPTSKKHLHTSLSQDRLASTGRKFGQSVKIRDLVATAYLPAPTVGQKLTYIDGNHENCAANNLRWV